MTRWIGNLKALIPLCAVSIALYTARDRIESTSETAGENICRLDSAAYRQDSSARTVVDSKDEVSSFDEAGMIAHDKRYSNYEYGYSIELPAGLKGYSSPAPLPQHGVRVILSKNPESYILIDGSYNTLFLESLDAAINQQFEWLNDDGSELKLLRRESTTLHSLPAMRLTVKYKSMESKQIRIQDLMIAFRPTENDAKGIIYTIALIAPEARYKKDALIFEQIVNRWRTKRLPG